MLVDRRAFRHTRKLGGIGKRHLFTGVSGRDNLILDLEVFLVGHLKSQLRTRARFILNLLHLRRIVLLGQRDPGTAHALIDLKRRRRQCALGIHGIDELEEVGAIFKGNGRLVNKNGVFDAIAIGNLLARLFDDVVLNGDDTAIGELFVS